MARQASGTVYPLSALRTVALHTQHLTASNTTDLAPTLDRTMDLVRALGYLQVDTLQVINRAHYVALWSRLGSYDTRDLDKLIYADGQRRLYEGWGHAASIIPLEHYRYHQWRTDPKYSFNPVFRKWWSKEGSHQLVDQVMARIRSEGALRVGAFDRDGSRRGPWWDWRPPKMALEALFARGDLMVADRVNFQRVYDVKERVMPAWVDTSPVPAEEARRFCLEQAAKALGVFDLRHLTFYAYMRATPVRSEVQALVEDGTLIEIRGESTEGVRKWMVHRENLPLLQRAADGDLTAGRTTFLSPFDSLFWAGGRDQRLWGFKQVLECYKPVEQRVYGYFCLPILHEGRLVGRLDPKLDREAGRLSVNALHLEPGVEPGDDLVVAVADAMRDFLGWHAAESIEIVKSDPEAFGKKLSHAL